MPRDDSAELILKTYFGAGGMLANAIDGYEDRPGQLDMAVAVMRALNSDGTAIVEAPTGTGKTLAYLIPALLYDRRVVVATGTKNLQEQIIRKDWPFLRDALGFDARVVLMKGRANYLCKHRWRLFNQQPRFRSPEEAAEFRRLQDWAAVTDTGDRSEVDWISDDDPLWSEITSTRYNCPGSACNQYGDCHLQAMRRRAASADIIVANHHLFFADLVLKETGPGEVIPDYHGVIFDEAHGLEDVATGFFAARLSSFQVDELDRDTVAAVSRLIPAEKAHVAALRSLRSSADAFFAQFPRGADEKRRLRVGEMGGALALYPPLRENLGHLAGVLSRLSKEADAPDLKGLSERVADLAEAADLVMNLEDDEYVHYADVRGRGVHLVAEPIEPGPRLREALFTNAGPVVFTSATLATDNSFRYFRERMGIDFSADERVLPTCFDYPTQSVLYLPRENFPQPNARDFMDAFIDEVLPILERARGRALLLFTSYRNLNEAFARLQGRLPYTLMTQGQGAKSALLERFRADTHSILLATQSFWEGVDVAGEALSCLVIDKLPFASPGEPLLEARIERINDRGGNAFTEYQVPQAIIALKQGLGRLIRRRTDKGLMVLTDVRVRTKGYGRRVLKSLPEFPVTGDRDKVLEYAGRL